jgi:hypothetical protein
MRDIELYRAILGLTPPWTVVKVDMDVKGQRDPLILHRKRNRSEISA